MEDAYRDLYRMNVERHYEDIVARLRDGKLLGQPVDMDDPKMIAVAAYYAGYYTGMGLPGLQETKACDG